MTTIYLCASDDTKKNHQSFIQDLKNYYSVKDINDQIFLDDSIVLVLGGDGSLNYLLNEIKTIRNQNIIYFACGTANDFAKSLRIIPMIPTVDKVNDIITRAPLIEVPVLLCNDRRFINVATAGALAQITDSGSDILKKLAGTLSYYISAIEKIVSPSTYRVLVRLDHDEELSIETNGFIISQGLYAGGGVKVSPHLSPSFRDNFNFLTLRSSDLGNSLGPIVKMQQSEEIIDLSETEIISKDLKNISIESDHVIPVKLDGEEYSSTKLEFSKDENTLNFYLY